MKNRFIFFLFSLSANITLAQSDHAHLHTRVIDFPDVSGYKSIVCDFHIHTVFSDGSVWPDIRVQEAMKDSVDAISLTEHLEYQPHEADIPHLDRNRSYDIAKQIALPYEKLMVIKGAEITRQMPPGHTNAVFIQDANKLMIEDSIEVFREVKRQGGFAFWNHPNWIAQKKDGIATLTETHKFLIKEGLLHGVEVVNDLTYSDEAFQIALDNDLAVMGTSDIHGLVDWQYKIDEGGHRPVTIVLGREKTPEGIREGLFAGRTVAYFNNLLVGKATNVIPLVEASLVIESAEYQGISSVIDVKIYNNSSVEYLLDNMGKFNFHSNIDVIQLPPHTTTNIEVKTLEQLRKFELSFKVLNAVIAPNVHPDIKLKVVVD